MDAERGFATALTCNKPSPAGDDQRLIILLRRFADEAAILDRALAIVPNDIGVRVQRAFIDLAWRADSKPLHSVIETILRENSKAAEGLVDQWLYLALCERDHAAANRVLSVMSEDGYTSEGFAFPKSWCEAVVARARGDTLTERRAFTAARAQVEKKVREQPEYAQALCVLGMIDAGLGRQAEAIREGQKTKPAARDEVFRLLPDKS